MSNRVKTILALSIVPQIIFVKWLAGYPWFIEEYYSTLVYPIISKGFRYVFGWVPFSVGDILYTILAVLIIRFLILKGKMFFNSTRYFLREVLLVVSFAYFVFHVFWGFNYYRLPIHKKLKIDNEYTSEELYAFTEKLVAKSNSIHSKLVDSDTIIVKIPYSKKEIYGMSINGYQNLVKKIPDFQYHPKSIKTSLYSTALTYMGYSGYLNPFTNEAQVNGLQLDFKYPTVSCHEEAHQIGYSAENEANFIAFLAATSNNDLYFQYSGYIYVLRYCLGEVKRRDIKKFEEFNGKIHPGIIKNYIEVANFWRRHKTKAEPVFKNTFNSFLKANNQKEGLKSYSYVVALLVNYYKDKNL
ncbi:DUF3810 domain-containing protein [Galbibacter sp. CMA-7]|uniref:DUF3810 domain-containing protein n=1 Tax=Galbibacter pacificus TaxID=2996052 RepID=A0ABT6FNF8_9FLAO|nr:DUF3810 domain-containing protein [Galbibacter pacificus]MDG3581329.1 DUF3810 domain-containing protein [Galbibacter pacificus]MDG3584807.1 DUF3810 domain-containing protein [Galbibacter pacificus]